MLPPTAPALDREAALNLLAETQELRRDLDEFERGLVAGKESRVPQSHWAGGVGSHPMTGEARFGVSITRSTLDVARQAVLLAGHLTELIDERSRCVAALEELEALVLEVDSQDCSSPAPLDPDSNVLSYSEGEPFPSDV